jgi:hypothetical protein
MLTIIVSMTRDDCSKRKPPWPKRQMCSRLKRCPHFTMTLTTGSGVLFLTIPCACICVRYSMKTGGASHERRARSSHNQTHLANSTLSHKPFSHHLPLHQTP